jgi:hypothetical protein
MVSPMAALTGLKVVRSSIHGYGLVATRAYKAGDTVCFGDGVLYREAETFDDTYCLVMPGYEVDDRGNEGPPLYWDLVDQTRWINHSCEPNTYVDSSWDAATKHITTWWVATRDIAPGDELTYDYAFCGHLAEACACGAPTCRGLIVDPDPEELVEVPAHLRHLLRLPVPALAQVAT